MALVGKSGVERGLREAGAGLYQPAHLIELSHGAKPARAGAERRSKLAGQRPAVETGHALQFSDRMALGWTRGNQGANAQQAREIELPRWPRGA